MLRKSKGMKMNERSKELSKKYSIEALNSYNNAITDYPDLFYEIRDLEPSAALNVLGNALRYQLLTYTKT